MLSAALYIVSTPIGNMKDITLRAIETLRDVDYIFSENKLETSKILRAHNIEKKQHTYRDENKNKVIPQIIDLIENGASVALVTDSGTPLISDPGFKLVESLYEKNLKVHSIPGATAVITALTMSGLPTDKFSFVGFLPKKGGERTKTLLTYGALDATLIIYESPHRVLKTLKDIEIHLGDRFICVTKELTKLHERAFYGKVKELLLSMPSANLKGEFVILVSKKEFRNQ